MNGNSQNNIDLVFAGINRFLSEGYNTWSKKNFKKLLEATPEIDEDVLVKSLIQRGNIEYVGENDIYIRVLKEIL